MHAVKKQQKIIKDMQCFVHANIREPLLSNVLSRLASTRPRHLQAVYPPCP